MHGDTAIPATLDAHVRSLLTAVDYTTVCGAVLVAVIAAAIIFRIRHGRAPGIEPLLRVVEACGVLVSGLLVAIVFLFTDPPAIEELSHEARAVAGFTTLLVSVHAAFNALRSAIWRRRRRRRDTRLVSVPSRHTFALPAIRRYIVPSNHSSERQL